MAVIAEANVEVLHDEGEGERIVLYRLRNVDSADTYNVNGKFTEVKAATFVPSGVLTGPTTPGVAGTTLTFTLATMADDTIYLLVMGQAVS